MEKAKVVDVTQISPGTYQYTVELLQGQFEGSPGQHTAIQNASGDTKPYSTLGVEGDRIILMIRDYGGDGVSNYMANRKPGNEIQVTTELRGNLTLNDLDRTIALIGTGSGLTPLMGILHEYVRGGGDDCSMLFGEKNTDQLLYEPLLRQYEVLYGINVEYVLSREEWAGREGYVQEHIDNVVDDVAEDTNRDFYICGVPKMVVETKDTLRDLGVPSDRIHSEGWEDSAT